MNEKEFYREILGVSELWEINRMELKFAAKEVHVYLEYCGQSGVCPKCGKAAGIHDTREERVWRDLDSCKYKTYVHCRIPRSKCEEHGTLTMDIPWSTVRSHFTNDFERLAIEFLLAAKNRTKVAELLDLSWDELDGIMQRAVKRGLGRREDTEIPYLGIDEKSFGKGQSYASILYDPIGRRVLEVTQKRDEEAVKGLYKSLSCAQLASVQAITMDFWQAFINGAESTIPEADIIHDKFHIMKYMNEAVDKVRRKEHAKLKKEKGRFEELNLDQLAVGRAWNRRELLQKFWDCTDESEAREFFKGWYFSATHSRLEPIIEVAKMIKRHFENIITYFKHYISNAFAEGMNSVIQHIKATARGFRNFQNYRTAILFYCGGLDLFPHKSR
jgi:transposase